MRALPDWITRNGVIVGLQGGQTQVTQNYNILKENGVPMAAVWLQDWVGTLEFPEGIRLEWNWKLNRYWYPGWELMTANWMSDGVKPMVYINPYFANLTDPLITRNLFKEGQQLGYFIKNSTGDIYLIKSVSIEFAIVDLTNPRARTWMKNIIKDNLIGEAGAYGWMLDFGEYTPFDVVLYSKEDPVRYHNRYPMEWARLNREVEDEVENGD